MNQQEITAAEAEIAQAKQRLQDALIAKEAAQKPLIALNGIEGYLIHLPPAIAADFAALVAQARSQI